MKHTLPSLAILLVLPLPLFAQTAASASSPSIAQPAYGQKLRIAGIPNAGKITDVLYRGAQPKEFGLSELKKLGITTIVDLRGEDREKVAWERKLAESLGVRVVHINRRTGRSIFVSVPQRTGAKNFRPLPLR